MALLPHISPLLICHPSWKHANPPPLCCRPPCYPQMCARPHWHPCLWYWAERGGFSLQWGADEVHSTEGGVWCWQWQWYKRRREEGGLLWGAKEKEAVHHWGWQGQGLFEWQVGVGDQTALEITLTARAMVSMWKAWTHQGWSEKCSFLLTLWWPNKVWRALFLNFTIRPSQAVSKQSQAKRQRWGGLQRWRLRLAVGATMHRDNNDNNMEAGREVILNLQPWLRVSKQISVQLRYKEKS